MWKIDFGPLVWLAAIGAVTVLLAGIAALTLIGRWLYLAVWG